MTTTPKARWDSPPITVPEPPWPPPRPVPTPEEDPACVKHEWFPSASGGNPWHCPHCGAQAHWDEL